MELTIPKHVAIIMDGNGRWAKERGKIRLEGHRQGAATLEKVIEHSIKIGDEVTVINADILDNLNIPELCVWEFMTGIGKRVKKIIV